MQMYTHTPIDTYMYVCMQSSASGPCHVGILLLHTQDGPGYVRSFQVVSARPKSPQVVADVFILAHVYVHICMYV